MMTCDPQHARNVSSNIVFQDPTASNRWNDNTGNTSRLTTIKNPKTWVVWANWLWQDFKKPWPQNTLYPQKTIKLNFNQQAFRRRIRTSSVLQLTHTQVASRKIGPQNSPSFTSLQETKYMWLYDTLKLKIIWQGYMYSQIWDDRRTRKHARQWK